MPDEKVPIRFDPSSDARTPVEAYLVEARSWGGHSGSPAFVYYPSDRIHGIVDTSTWEPALLGLVQGHYEILQDAALPGDILEKVSVPINSGIAVIIPAQKIMDTLMQEELVDKRNEVLQASRRLRHNPQSNTDRNV